MSPTVRGFDRRLSGLIQNLPKSLKQLMEAVSFVGQPFIVLTVGFFGFVSAVSRHQPQVERAFVYAFLAFMISVALKRLLHRSRPHDLDVRTLGFKSYSFPSGHAFGTVIFYGLFSYLDLKFLHHPLNIFISVALWLIIGLIGVSRIYLKTHYPSDVVGGWLLGLLSLLIIVKLAF